MIHVTTPLMVAIPSEKKHLKKLMMTEMEPLKRPAFKYIAKKNMPEEVNKENKVKKEAKKMSKTY